MSFWNLCLTHLAISLHILCPEIKFKFNQKKKKQQERRGVNGISVSVSELVELPNVRRWRRFPDSSESHPSIHTETSQAHQFQFQFHAPPIQEAEALRQRECKCPGTHSHSISEISTPWFWILGFDWLLHQQQLGFDSVQHRRLHRFYGHRREEGIDENQWRLPLQFDRV